MHSETHTHTHTFVSYLFFLHSFFPSFSSFFCLLSSISLSLFIYTHTLIYHIPPFFLLFPIFSSFLSFLCLSFIILTYHLSLFFLPSFYFSFPSFLCHSHLPYPSFLPFFHFSFPSFLLHFLRHGSTHTSHTPSSTPHTHSTLGLVGIVWPCMVASRVPGVTVPGSRRTVACWSSEALYSLSPLVPGAVP